jgi:hypothetical protein
MTTATSLDTLRASADAEHLANLAGLDTGPWKGAKERLATAEAADAAERAADAAAAQEAAERARAGRFATLVREYTAAIAQRRERAAAIAALDDRMAALADAAKTLDHYHVWRQQPAAVDLELIRQSSGGVPPEGHFLYGLSAVTLEKMREVEDVRRRRQSEEQLVAAAHHLMRSMESEFPALKELRDDA